MCVVSMITQFYIDKWGRQVPYPSGGGTTGIPWQAPQDVQNVSSAAPNQFIPPLISPAEVAEFRALLERAREYDRKNNEPSCELEEKKKTLLNLAKQLNVQIDFL